MFSLLSGISTTQPGFNGTLRGGGVRLGGHGLVPGGSIGGVALWRSSLTVWASASAGVKGRIICWGSAGGLMGHPGTPVEPQ